MADPNAKLPRHILPIPDREACRPDDLRRQRPQHEISADRAAAAARRRAERADRAARRCRLRRLERVWRTLQHAHRRAPGGQRPEVQPLPHHGSVLADAPGDAHRPQPSLGRHGRDHRNGDVGARQQQHPAQGQGAARRNPEAQRLFDGAVRQVPRGAVLGGLARGAFPSMADRLGVRVFLRLHRRRGEPVLSRPLRRHDGGRAAQNARGGLYAHRGPRRSRHHLGAPAEGADARQAVLHVFRAGRDARAPSRAEGMVGQIQGQVRRRLGQAARGDIRPAEEAGRRARTTRS